MIFDDSEFKSSKILVPLQDRLIPSGCFFLHLANSSISPIWLTIDQHYLPSEYQGCSRNAASPSVINYEMCKGIKYRLVPSPQTNYSPTAKLRTVLWQYV